MSGIFEESLVQKRVQEVLWRKAGSKMLSELDFMSRQLFFKEFEEAVERIAPGIARIFCYDLKEVVHDRLERVLLIFESFLRFYDKVMPHGTYTHLICKFVGQADRVNCSFKFMLDLTQITELAIFSALSKKVDRIFFDINATSSLIFVGDKEQTTSFMDFNIDLFNEKITWENIPDRTRWKSKEDFMYENFNCDIFD